MQTEEERISSVILHFCKSKAEFARQMGESSQTVSNWVSRGAGKTVLNKILSKFPEVNTNWLLTGDGVMLNPDREEPTDKEEEEPKTEEEDKPDGSIIEDEPKVSFTAGVPYYNVDFIGGFDLVMNDQTINPEYLIDFKKYNDAMCWCNVTGHSMEPEINNGDMIALKEVKSWRDYLPFGEVYGIVTDEHRTIKRVTSSLKGENYLRLIPTNKSEEYQPQDIPTRLIIAVYKVLGCNKRL